MIAPRHTDERGFTMVEVLVATLILTLGAMATFGLLSTATKNTQRAKATQVALDRAQQEIERLRSLSNKQLAMTTTPEHSPDPLNPNYRVVGQKFALIRQPPSGEALMVVNTRELYGGGFIEGGVVNPGPTPFSSGDVTGEIYRYVVWRNDDACGTGCPGEQDFKQVVVAVKLDTPGNQAGERGYVEVQSDFVDPTDSPKNDPLPGPDNKVVTAQQFFLSDTPCSATADGTTVRTIRQGISGDHPLHNTLGTCANGAQTGRTAGAPDALVLGGPPDPAPEDPNDPSVFDYSSDPFLEPTLNPEKDKGLQIRRDANSDGCLPDPAKETTSLDPQSQVHRWVTDPMGPSGFTLTGQVTLEFYTRTINMAQHKAMLCVYLFKRHGTEDTILKNAKTGTGSWTYPASAPTSNWFASETDWERVRLAMPFSSPPYPIAPGDRLGVAISLERKNTPAEAIEIVYDHPNYPARIEVDTNTPFEGG